MFDVVVIGAANMDVKAKLDGLHIPATSNIGKVNLSAGGVGRNIAHNLSSLGVSVALISVFGADALGHALRQETSNAGVELTHSLTSEIATGTYIAMLDSSGELITAVNDMRGIGALGINHLTSCHDILATAKWIVADCNLESTTLAFLAQNYGHKLVVETVSIEKSKNLLRALAVASVALATPNQAQLFAMTNCEDLAAACQVMLTKGLKTIVTHCGAEGAIFATENQPIRKIQQLPVDTIVDVTGAGDAAVAGLVFGLVNNFTLEKSVQFGQAVARAVLQIETSVLTKYQANDVRKQL